MNVKDGARMKRKCPTDADDELMDCKPCGSMNEGWHCTRPSGHYGSHHAHAQTGFCCKVWFNRNDKDKRKRVKERGKRTA